MIRKFTLKAANVYQKVNDKLWFYSNNINKEEQHIFAFHPMEITATKTSKRKGFVYEVVCPSDYVFEVVRMFKHKGKHYVVVSYNDHYYRLPSQLTRHVHLERVSNRKVVRYTIK